MISPAYHETVNTVLGRGSKQQFSVWALKLRVRALRARTLSFKARKQAACGGLFAG